MIETGKNSCEYFRLYDQVNAEGHIATVPTCVYSDEYHQKTTCDGNRENCAYPEKWGK
jgi:hypothetical protein